MDLTDLIQGRIDSDQFFEENYLTDGMKSLLREAFRRFEGRSDSGVIKLTQAMGGGKTHNMIVLGLLAKYPQFRKKVMGSLYEPSHLGEVRVIAFTGRESDSPYGIWGALAEQLGKKDEFREYYSPLKAPGQTAWVNLLKGEPTLILLDELAPYLENAESIAVGNSDLSIVTTTAISNLLVSVGKGELSKVCVVISDLKATRYRSGSDKLNKALQNLESEVGRVALPLEPVALNTDEVYQILRTRLFKDIPNTEDIRAVAQAFAKAASDAKQMDITNVSPEKLAGLIEVSYPFHPAIKDLYARFRENPGFQQTRGLIKLMRIVVSRLYDETDGKADSTYLINAHNLDLNDRETLAEIAAINPTLNNAISHDIASNGQAMAEIIDENRKSTDAQDICKLLFVSSLANVPNSVVGLSQYEIAEYLCAPDRDITKIKETIGLLSTKVWYLHSNREGKLFFKNVQNLVAKLTTTAESYNRESALKELKSYLERIFTPTQKDCYQDTYVLPALDDIKIVPDKVSLIIYEPNPGGLHPDLQKFYNDLDFKNRVLFLSGQRPNLESLLEIAREYKAILYILEEMDSERVSDNDPQRAAAQEILDKIQLRLLSGTRETFTTLTYPVPDRLLPADFSMNFKDNEYRGEHQIREALRSKQKFTDEVSGDIFRNKCEKRLFTQKEMPWSEIKKRAAMNTSWQWHLPSALDHLKEEMITKDQWRESGGYIDKGPFPLPKSYVQIQEISRDDDSGEVALKLTPVNGDTIFYEVGLKATTGSNRISDFKAFKTGELQVSFLCVDSKKEHDPEEPKLWRNRITLKSKTFQKGADKMVELRSAPDAQIRYTTDGSDPKNLGAVYNAPFIVPSGSVFVLAVAEKDGILSEQHKIGIDWSHVDGFKVDPEKPIILKRTNSPKTTKESYELLGSLKKHHGLIPGPRITIMGNTGSKWVELAFGEKLDLTPEKIEELIVNLRGILTEGQVNIEADGLKFQKGQYLLDWVAEVKTEIGKDEVEQ